MCKTRNIDQFTNELLTKLFYDSTESSLPNTNFNTCFPILPTGHIYRKTTKDNVILTTNLAGMKKEYININIIDNELIIDVRKPNEREVPDTIFFLRRVSIKNDYDIDNIKSTFVDGILEITIPIIKPKSTRIVIE